MGSVHANQWRLTIVIAVAGALTETRLLCTIVSSVLDQDQCTARWSVAIIDRIDIARRRRCGSGGTTTTTTIGSRCQFRGNIIIIHSTPGHGTQIAALEAIQTKVAVPIGIAIALTFAQWKQQWVVVVGIIHAALAAIDTAP
jgi:hypothetical protein